MLVWLPCVRVWIQVVQAVRLKVCERVRFDLYNVRIIEALSLSASGALENGFALAVAVRFHGYIEILLPDGASFDA